MEMMKKMGSGGGLEVESRVVEMRCNTGIPDAMELAMTFLAGANNWSDWGGVKGTELLLCPFFIQVYAALCASRDKGSSSTPAKRV